MAKIPEQVKDFLKSHLVFVATADGRGVPNVVPKGAVAVLDDDTLVFADLYSRQTKKNLKNNPHIALTVVNPAGYTGYQIKGTAQVIERGSQFDELSRRAAGEGQLGHAGARYAVKITVRQVINIGYGDTDG